MAEFSIGRKTTKNPMAVDSWTIGSNASCDLVVENPTVSGRHCRLIREGTTFLVEDLGSTNGTYVNARRTDRPTTVTPSDHITLGLSEPMPWPEVDTGGNHSPNDPDNALEDRTRVVTIGRNADNDIVLSGSNVSSTHARLTMSSEGILLEDLGSTNGTSVGTVENKVLRSVVDSGETIFFGSTPYRVSDLLSQLETSPEEGSQKRRKEAGVDATWLKQRSTVIVSVAILCVATAALLFGISMTRARNPMSSRPASAVPQPETPAARPAMMDVASSDRSQDPDTEATASLSADRRKTSDRSQATKIPKAPQRAGVGDADASAPDQKLEHSLFLIVCEDPDDQIPFRVGTGFAISPNRVATSASVINAMRELQDNGFSRCMLYSPATAESLPISSAEVHPQHRQANTKAREAKRRHDDIIAKFEAEPPNPNELESLKQKLIDARIEALKAIEQQTCYDVGVFEVDRKLTHWLRGVDAQTSLRPNMKLRVSGYAFDIQDPYFEPSASFVVSSMTGRLRQLVRADRDSPPRVLATAAPEQSEYAYLGSPVTDDQGNVVAVYSRPTPSQPGEDAAPPSETFDAPLYARLRDWLVQ